MRHNLPAKVDCLPGFLQFASSACRSKIQNFENDKNSSCFILSTVDLAQHHSTIMLYQFSKSMYLDKAPIS